MSRELQAVERRRGPRPLAARMLMARLGWLEGLPVWHLGRIAWENDGVVIPIGPAELSRAQRHLNRIRELPAAATAVLGDRDAWLADRRARLEHAKRLARLDEADPARSAERAARRDPAAVARLVALLQAEAECVSGFPRSAARDLVRAGSAAEDSLRRALADPDFGLPARVLAALTMGAVLRGADEARPAGAAGVPAPIARALQYCRQHGMPEHPALAALLMAEQADVSLVSRLEAALRSRSLFALTPDAVRRILASPGDVESLVRLAERCAGTDRLTARLLNRPQDDDPDSPFRKASTQSNRAAEAAGIAAIMNGLVSTLREPEAVSELFTLLEMLLELSPVFPGFTSMIRRLLERVAALPHGCIAPVVRLLTAHHHQLWEPATVAALTETARLKRRLGPLGSHLEQRCALWARPLVDLAGSTGCFAEAGELVERGWITGFGRPGWEHPWHLQSAVQLSRGVLHDYPGIMASTLHEFLGALPAESGSRAIIRHLTGTLEAWAPEHRWTILEGVCSTVWEFESRFRWTQALLALVEWIPRPGVKDAVDDTVVERLSVSLQLAASVLDEARPRDGEDRALLGSIPRGVCSGTESWVARKNLAFGGRLAVVLARGDVAAVGPALEVIAAGLGDEERFEARPGLALLRKCPSICRALLTMMPVQAGRCFKLLAQLAYAGALGPAAARAVVSPEMPEPDPSLLESLRADPAWSALIEGLGEGDQVLADYVSARQVLGRGVALPAGVARELSQPARWREELDFLERRLTVVGTGADLAGRAESLRDRLSSGARQDIVANAVEKFRYASAEAQLAALAHNLQRCFRERLEALVGQLPQDLEFDDDLMNAVLLSSNIDVNRPLLRKLIRAHFAGDRTWRERQSANAAFLAGLRERGTDPAIWLARHTRKDAAGTFTLWLETEPLRILQMGNYFNTCLGFGQCNAYSAVANAGDLNKRVLYVADPSGRIVGRKLLAVNTDWQLVGFQIYSSLATQAEDAALTRAVRRFVKWFARRCSLEMSEMGAVSRLIAKQWYDDGIVKWNEKVCGKLRTSSVDPGGAQPE